MQQSEDHGPLLEKFRPYLRMLARTQLNPRLQSRIDASDLAQETLLRAHEGIARLQDTEKIQAWLKGILANVAKEQIRNSRADKRDIEREQALSSLEGSSRNLEEWLAASGLGPSGQAAHNEQLLELARALEELPANQRQAIEWRFFHRHSVNEVAKIMNITPAAVAGLVRRGLDSLRAHLTGKNDAKSQTSRGPSR